MRCEACHGIGLIEVPAECATDCADEYCPYVHVPYTEPCPACGGSGVSHCCEGDRACPDAAATPPKDTPDAG